MMDLTTTAQVVTREMFDDWLDAVAPDQKVRLSPTFALLTCPGSVVFSGSTKARYEVVGGKLVVTPECSQSS